VYLFRLPTAGSVAKPTNVQIAAAKLTVGPSLDEIRAL